MKLISFWFYVFHIDAFSCAYINVVVLEVDKICDRTSKKRCSELLVQPRNTCLLLIFIDVVLKIFVDVTGEEFQKLLKERAARRHGAWSICIHMERPRNRGALRAGKVQPKFKIFKPLDVKKRDEDSLIELMI